MDGTRLMDRDASAHRAPLLPVAWAAPGSADVRDPGCDGAFNIYAAAGPPGRKGGPSSAGATVAAAAGGGCTREAKTSVNFPVGSRTVSTERRCPSTRPERRRCARGSRVCNDRHVS
jgi:hypothetical protein